jgi:hypothetical protein
MKIWLDLAIHWLFSAAFILLTFSGLAMIGVRLGWVPEYTIAAADYVHRSAAVLFIALALLDIACESVRLMAGNKKKRTAGLFKPQGFGLFTLIVTVGFTISGVMLWESGQISRAALAFAVFVHEKLTYVALAGVIWHIYQKAYILVWPRQRASGTRLTVHGFKLLIWILSGAFLVAGAAAIISLAGLEANSSEFQQFMAATLQAMDSSLLELAGPDIAVTPAAPISVMLTVLILIFVLVASAALRQRRGNK